MKILLFYIIFASACFAQAELPEIGSVADLTGKTKVYLVADGPARKPIQSTLDKQSTLVQVNKPEDADFFILYKTVASPSFRDYQYETGQIDVYFFRDKRKVLAWSSSATEPGTGDDTSYKLIRKFLKVLKESSPSAKSK